MSTMMVKSLVISAVLDFKLRPLLWNARGSILVIDCINFGSVVYLFILKTILIQYVVAITNKIRIK